MSKIIIFVDVEDQLRPFLAAALVRFGYLHPDVEVVVTAAQAHEDSDEELVRDFQLTLYRQKIYEENRQFRSRIMERVLG